MDADELRSLIAQGENEAVEFKSTLLPARMVARNLAALANTRGGVLILGVEEPDRIVGVDPKTAARFTRSAVGYLEPSIRVETTAVQDIRRRSSAS